MALIEFKNLPDTSTPLNAENLNNNFNEVKHQDIITNGNAVKCGYKVDGKDVYIKKFNFGNLPNNNYRDVSIEINENIDILKVEGIATATSGNKLPLPYAAGGNGDIIISYQNASKSIRIQTATDRTTFTAVISIYFIYS